MNSKLLKFSSLLGLVLALILPLAFSGCSSDDAEDSVPELKLLSDHEVVPGTGGIYQVGLEIVNPIPRAKVYLKTDAEWLGDLVYHTESQQLSFTAAPNKGEEQRSGQITVSYPSAKPVVLTVTQEVVKPEDTLQFNTSAYSVYQSQGNSMVNYYLLFTTVPYTVDEDSQISLDEEGYMISLDLYALNKEPGTLPTGSYHAAPGNAVDNRTYSTNYTSVIYQNGAINGPQVPYQLNSDVVVEYQNEEYYIHGSFDKDGRTVPFEFRGQLDLEDAAQGGGQLPIIGHDVEVVGYKAVGTYFGNLLQSDTGMMTINIMDKTYSDEATDGQGGYAVSLAVFTQLFPQTNLISLVPGTYQVGTQFQKKTWLPGMEINAMGTLMPFGTYAHCDDGTGMGQFLYGADGTITIEAITSGYRISYDLVSPEGHRITGSYEGMVDIVDESNDQNKDDGTSTLTDDHDMNLSPIRTARLFKLGDIEHNDGTVYTHNRIDIGSRGGWDMEDVLKTGDTFTMDLVMEKDAEGKIVPGTYEVSTDHFPASILPGVAIRGYLWSGEYMATGWLHYDTSKPQDLYLDGHAAAYGGEIVVEKSDLGENYYTFTIDMVCVRKMHVRGSWTGPVIEANSGQPVLPFFSSSAAPQKRGVRMDAEKVQAAGRQLLKSPCLLNGKIRKTNL